MLRFLFSGSAAGLINGFFGTGGGMVLVFLLGRFCHLPQRQIFPGSLAIMVPVCLTSLLLSPGALPWIEALPYLLGSFLGGVLTPALSKRIPVFWLHRVLGLTVIFGGGVMLWQSFFGT